MSILVLMDVNEKQKKQLEAAAPSVKFIYASPDSVGGEQLGTAEVILGNPSPEKLKTAVHLKWLQLQSAGAAEYVQPGVLRDGVFLTNASGAYGQAVAEHMLALLFMLYKKLHLYRDNQHRSLWQDAGPVRSIRGATVLIVGAGDIGGTLAQLLHVLGAYTVGVRRQEGIKPGYLDELYTNERLDDLLPRADIVALCVPGTPETTHMINAERLGRMKETAVLLNAGRGNAVDTTALCAALQNGRLLGAGVDVTDPEPLPPEHLLWTLPNCIITPHVSGGKHLSETFDRIIDITVQNLRAYQKGNPLINEVDFKSGYSMSLQAPRR